MIKVVNLKLRVKQKRDEFLDDIKNGNYNTPTEEQMLRDGVYFMDTIIKELDEIKNEL
jgi:hypothetical protein